MANAPNNSSFTPARGKTVQKNSEVRGVKIKSNPMHALHGVLPLQYVPARVTLGALVAHRYSFVPSRCRTSHYLRTFAPLSASLWNNLSDPVIDGVGLDGFNPTFLANFLHAFTSGWGKTPHQ